MEPYFGVGLIIKLAKGNSKESTQLFFMEQPKNGVFEFCD